MLFITTFPNSILLDQKLTNMLQIKLCLCINKTVSSMTKKNMFDKEVILVIINEPVSKNIQTNIETMYHKGLDELSSGINPVLEKHLRFNNLK